MMRSRKIHGVRAAFRSLWWPLQLRDGVMIFVPAAAPRMVAEADGLLHAVTVSLAPTRRRTVDTLCGLTQHARPVLVDDGPNRALVPIWPPPARFEGRQRCEDCVAFSGVRRPHSMWLGITLAPAEPQAVSA